MDSKSVIKIFPWMLILLLSATVYIFYLRVTTIVEPDRVQVRHNMIVEKISSLGKLELAKFYVKDIIEHKVIKDWLPDPKVILIASGEVAGCIDLSLIDSTHIVFEKEFVTIALPEPEICYYKINHKESKVYHVEYHYFEHAKLIDQAYQYAEKHIEQSAKRMNLEQQTKVSAEIILKPLFENITGKKVYFTYQKK